MAKEIDMSNIGSEQNPCPRKGHCKHYVQQRVIVNTMSNKKGHCKTHVQHRIIAKTMYNRAIAKTMSADVIAKAMSN